MSISSSCSEILIIVLVLVVVLVLEEAFLSLQQLTDKAWIIRDDVGDARRFGV
jgi:hypothetical protein